jgi:5'-nucleotidase (lipoprotein e(P4) family)
MFKHTLSAAVAFAALTLVACSDAAPVSDAESTESDIKIGKPPVVAPPATPAPTGPAMPANLHWFRNSAERQALSRQTFSFATIQLEEKIGYRFSKQAWAVVLDADETILDNSQFQKESFEQNLAFSPDRWTAWVHRKEAKAIPGAAAFLKRVHTLGGKVVIVTNRSALECPDSELNLKSQGLAVDAVLCKADTSDKNPRFAAVAAGTASPKLGALEVLMFVGDNIQDFPALDQTANTEAKQAEFGSRFFVMPNPMYGSWEKNAQN